MSILFVVKSIQRKGVPNDLSDNHCRDANIALVLPLRDGMNLTGLAQPITV